MFSFLKKATSRLSPSTWSPVDPPPFGTESHKLPPFKLPISSFTNVHFIASEGAWSHGTVVFECRENVQPPSYDIATAVDAKQGRQGGVQLGDGQAFLEVHVEARYNDEELFKESKVEFVKVGQDDVRFSIQTPSMSPSRLASHLSFYVTFSFPPNVSALTSLSTSGSQWRTLGLPSLNSLHITTVSISTANTPISFASLQTRTATLSTANGKIDGSYRSDDSLTAKTVNGSIEGHFTVGGEAILSTSNAPIKAEVKAEKLNATTANNSITGSYEAPGGVSLESVNGKIDTTVVGYGGARLATQNATVSGTFMVGKELVLKTSNAAIEAKIHLVGGERPRSRATTPPLLDSKPTYEAATNTRIATEANGSGRSEGKVVVTAHTSNNKIMLDFVEHPNGIVLEGEAKSSNGAVTIIHAPPFAGQFDLRTSNGTATIETPDDHNALFRSQSRTNTSGTISTTTADGTVNHFSLKTSNAPVKFVVDKFDG